MCNFDLIAGNPRNKTALAPGHSLMDWIRLGSSNVDLTGVGGVHQVVTLTELAKHNKRNDAWLAVRGLFSYLKQIFFFFGVYKFFLFFFLLFQVLFLMLHDIWIFILVGLRN